ncbi:MAG: hypothetical protein M3Y72_08175 [Acidobacteriota bacterium]|nr:hypothetical protein [Acidobacteriota bacterium]
MSQTDYAELLSEATERLGANSRIEIGHDQGNHQSASQYVGTVAGNANALRWAADTLEHPAGPVNLARAKGVGEEKLLARGLTTDIDCAVDLLASHAQRTGDASSSRR